MAEKTTNNRPRSDATTAVAPRSGGAEAYIFSMTSLPTISFCTARPFSARVSGVVVDWPGSGNARDVLAAAHHVIEADCSFPDQNHAPMEVLSATIRWTPEHCEMWGATQVAEAALALQPSALDLMRAILPCVYRRR